MNFDVTQTFDIDLSALADKLLDNPGDFAEFWAAIKTKAAEKGIDLPAFGKKVQDKYGDDAFDVIDQVRPEKKTEIIAGASTR